VRTATGLLDAIRADLFRDLLRGVPLPEAAHRLWEEQETAQTASFDCTGSDGVPLSGAVDSGPVGAGDVRPMTDADVWDAVERQVAEALAGAVDEHLRRLLTQARQSGRVDGLALLIAEAVGAMDTALRHLRDQWSQATGRHASEGYRPPARMRRQIRRRHRTCVFPTCNRRAMASDLDHTRPYGPDSPGGDTRHDNLAPLCRRHHRTKQHPHWRLAQIFPGLLVWITPAGRWHIVRPFQE
jgi:hypothetical protein